MENKTKKSKLKKETKEKIFKILHFISYVLSLLFIIICIATGVTSCQSQNKTSKSIQRMTESSTNYSFVTADFNPKFFDVMIDFLIDNNYSQFLASNVFGNYKLNLTRNASSVDYAPSNHSGSYYNYFTFDNSDQSYYLLYIRSNNYTNTTYFQFKLSKSGNYFYDVWHYVNGYLSNIYMVYSMVLEKSGITQTSLDLIDLYTSEGGGYTEEEVEEMTSQAYDEGYSLGHDEGYSLGYEEGYQYAEGIYNTSLDEIIINYAYDFRSLLCTNVDSQTGAMYFNTAFVDSTPVIKDLFGLTFLCNSNTYNFIRLSYMPLDSSDALFYDSTNNLVIASEFFGSTNYLHYAKLLNVYYGYYGEDLEEVTTIDKVYNGIQFEQGSYSGTNTIGQDLRNPKFLNNSFRYIKILENTGERVNVNGYGANYTLAQILSFDGQVATTNDSMFSMFSLFSSAFGSISGLLSIAILPNITLGLLMFIPLFVGIIVIIIRTIKK